MVETPECLLLKGGLYYIYVYIIVWFLMDYHVLVNSPSGLVAFVYAPVSLLKLDQGRPCFYSMVNILSVHQ